MRKIHPFYFFAGYRIYRCAPSLSSQVIDLCRQIGVSFLDGYFIDDGFCVCVPFFSSFRFERSARKCGIDLNLLSSRGAPALIMRYRHRYGLFLGVLLSICAIFLSSGVIWDVRIDGERRLCESEVCAVLAECGLEIGTKKSDIDVDTLQNRVMIYSDDIAWISVNIIGTVAEVEIRELDLALDGEGDTDDTVASNLVSSSDGRVVGFEDVRGNIAVEIGESISRGQLLVGGIYGDEESGVRYLNADGRVYAECNEHVDLKIERVQSQKRYTGKVKSEKYLIFFKKRIKFFANYRNLPPSCDKIVVEEYLRAPRGLYLPVGICEVRYLEYEYVEQTLDDASLLSIADQRLDALIATTFKDAEILKISCSHSLTETALTLDCKIKCVRNVAVRKKIEVE